uniref:NADH-ubiquinone oxidoreductase chain 4 n=1 Tax=Cypridopsis vidua TaxID=230730 RepID=A0A0N6WAJ2_9CRUS|nr:NADH dehydrogenase subunit 4 [Cypridopsis vidua]AJY78610.1 NADH dehydrogenase subunit 4 [Cypridopsis vidua]
MMMMALSVVIMLFFMKMSYYMVELVLILLALKFFWVLMNLKVNFYLLNDLFFVDWLNLLLMFLTLVVIFLLLSASYTSIIFFKKNLLLFCLVNIIMCLFLILSFLSIKLIFFYVFFEASLIPIFLLIMGWGYQPERLQAAIYMLFYTLLASLPLLLIILMMQNLFSYFSLNEFILESSKSMINLLIMFFMILAFLVKLPMFFFHLWLPKAHVEAPVAGSMILAGVMLKLGSFGLWRVLSSIVKVFNLYSYWLVVLGLIGGLLVSFVCFIQVDMKSLVAYSSVVHMGILLSGVSSLSFIGFEGALALMLGHGIVSSGLFYLVGVNYDRVHSRSLMINKGMMILFPSMTIMWFILSVFNISAPPSVSLFGEILLSSSVLFYSSILFWGLMLMNFMGMVFTFYLYAQTQQGKTMNNISCLMNISLRELYIGFFHSMSMMLLILVFW